MRNEYIQAVSGLQSVELSYTECTEYETLAMQVLECIGLIGE